MSWFVLQLCLACVFARASLAHTRDVERFRGVLDGLNMPSSAAVVRGVAAVDAAIAVALVFAPVAGGWMALSYLVGVTLLIAVRGGSGTPIADCGCSSAAKPVTRAFFIRNAVFVLTAIFVASQPDVAPAGVALATMPAAFLVGADLLPQRRKRAEAARQTDVADDSRRRVLKLAAASAGAVASMPVLPALAKQGTVWGVTRKGRGSIRVQTLGTGLSQPEVQTALQRPEIATLSRLPHAPMPAWDRADVVAETLDQPTYTVRTRVVIAPLVRPDGKFEGLVYVQNGDVTYKKGTTGPVEIEERVQVETISNAQLLLIDENATWAWEDSAPAKHRQRSSDTNAVVADICTDVWTAEMMAEDAVGCRSRVYRHVCRPDCVCYYKRCCTRFDPCDCTGSCRFCCFHCDNECGTTDCCEFAGVNCSLC